MEFTDNQLKSSSNELGMKLAKMRVLIAICKWEAE
jgi:hypothetical protein